MSRNTKILVAFVAGQIVQIILNILASQNYMRFPILFCGAAGFLVLVAVVAGVYIGSQNEAVKPKSYHDYANGR